MSGHFNNPDLEKVIEDVIEERMRQKTTGNADIDSSNTRNDWIAFINAYIGRSAARCFRNKREGQEFRANMVKAAALCVAAIEAHDKGYC